jgi:hypothetical protein
MISRVCITIRRVLISLALKSVDILCKSMDHSLNIHFNNVSDHISGHIKKCLSSAFLMQYWGRKIGPIVVLLYYCKCHWNAIIFTIFSISFLSLSCQAMGIHKNLCNRKMGPHVWSKKEVPRLLGYSFSSLVSLFSVILYWI